MFGSLSPSRARAPRRLAVLAIIGAAALAPRRALAQACCAGGAVVTPARLALHEDLAVGLQVRARANQGSFGADGTYVSSTGAEHVMQQDLVAAARLASRAQVGALLPFVQTHRSAGTLDDWGGGLGDVSLTGRYDPLLQTETVHWPGIGVLAAVTAPTGRPPDRASHALAADVTGSGAYEVTMGLALEKGVGHVYGALAGWLTHRFDRTVSGAAGTSVTETFGLRWTAQAVAGYVFENEAALAAYVTSLNERPASVDGVRDPSTSLRLTTLGIAAVLPVRDVWRLQGSVSFDVPLQSFGRNEPAGYGLAASLVRVWL